MLWNVCDTTLCYITKHFNLFIKISWFAIEHVQLNVTIA